MEDGWEDLSFRRVLSKLHVELRKYIWVSDLFSFWKFKKLQQ